MTIVMVVIFFMVVVMVLMIWWLMRVRIQGTWEVERHSTTESTGLSLGGAYLQHASNWYLLLGTSWHTMWSWVTMVSHWVPSFWTKPYQESLLFEACQTLVETHEKEELVMLVKQWLPPYFDGPFMVKSGMVVLLLLYEHHMCVETYLPLRSGYDFTLCHFSAGPFEMSVDVNNYLSLNKPGRISRIQYFIANDCITQYHKQFGSIG